MRALFVIGLPGRKHFEGSSFKAFIPSLRCSCIQRRILPKILGERQIWTKYYNWNS